MDIKLEKIQKMPDDFQAQINDVILTNESAKDLFERFNEVVSMLFNCYPLTANERGRLYRQRSSLATLEDGDIEFIYMTSIMFQKHLLKVNIDQDKVNIDQDKFNSSILNLKNNFELIANQFKNDETQNNPYMTFADLIERVSRLLQSERKIEERTENIHRIGLLSSAINNFEEILDTITKSSYSNEGLFEDIIHYVHNK